MTDAAPKPTKVAKAKAPKAPAKHPKFNVMIVEAITLLKDRSGSSLPAIKKAVGEKHGKDLPKNWEKQVTMAIRRMVTSGALAKVKASFKLGEVTKKKAVKKPAAKKPAGEKKPAGVKKVSTPKKKAAGDKKKATPKKKPAAPKAKKPAAAKKATTPKKKAAAPKKPKTTTPKAKKPAAPKVKKTPTKKAAPKKPKAAKATPKA